MKLKVNKKMLLSLINGTTPHYGVFNHPLLKQCGHYIGGFVERWDWDCDKLDELTEEQLVQLYNVCNDETLNIPAEIVEDKYPITEEQRKNKPEFATVEEELNWELSTSINNKIVGETLNKLK